MAEVAQQPAYIPSWRALADTHFPGEKFDEKPELYIRAGRAFFDTFYRTKVQERLDAPEHGTNWMFRAVELRRLRVSESAAEQFAYGLGMEAFGQDTTNNDHTALSELLQAVHQANSPEEQ